jgi:hypothetical protein
MSIAQPAPTSATIAPAIATPRMREPFSPKRRNPLAACSCAGGETSGMTPVIAGQNSPVPTPASTAHNASATSGAQPVNSIPPIAAHDTADSASDAYMTR